MNNKNIYNNIPKHLKHLSIEKLKYCCIFRNRQVMAVKSKAFSSVHFSYRYKR